MAGITVYVNKEHAQKLKIIGIEPTEENIKTFLIESFEMRIDAKLSKLKSGENNVRAKPV